MLLALHEGLQTLGNGDVCTQNLIDLLLELGGMGGLAEYADLTGLEVLLQGTIAAGTVRVEDVARISIALAHGLCYLLVAIGSTADERRDTLVRLLCRQFAVLGIKVEDTGKVRRVTNIHLLAAMKRLMGSPIW